MNSTPQVERLRRKAKRLHAMLHCANHTSALEAASRFRRLRRYRNSSSEDVFRRRTEILLKHALAVIADEHGFSGWPALLREHGVSAPWSSQSFFAVWERLSQLPPDEAESEERLIEAVMEAGAGSRLEAQTHAGRYRAIERWISGNTHLLRTSGLIDGAEGAVVPHRALIDVLCAVSTGQQPHEMTFDLYRTTGDALLRVLGWSRGIGQLATPHEADPLPLSLSARVTAETWCYATPGDGTACRMPWDVVMRLLCGWKCEINPAWRAPDGSLQMVGVVVLRVDGVVRFIERADAMVTHFPVLVIGPVDYRRYSTQEENFSAVMSAVLAEAGAATEDAEVLTHLLTDLRAVTSPVSLEKWPAHIILEEEHVAVAEAAVSADRGHVLWDFASRHLVAPGIPLRAAVVPKDGTEMAEEPVG